MGRTLATSGLVMAAALAASCAKKEPAPAPLAAAVNAESEPEAILPPTDPTKPGDPGQMIILTGAASKEEARDRLGDLQIPPDIVPRPGWPKVLESSKVKGLNPGLFIVALGFCKDRAAFERKLDDGRDVYFQWTHVDTLIRHARASFKGSYAKKVELDDDACPVWRGPRPKSGPAQAAWDKLGSSPDDAAAWVAMFDAATDPDSSSYFTLRALEVDPTNEAALDNLGG